MSASMIPIACQSGASLTRASSHAGIFHRVAVPYIPNAFIFIGSRLFYQGEPELENNTPEGFISQVEAAVGIAGGESTRAG